MFTELNAMRKGIQNPHLRASVDKKVSFVKSNINLVKTTATC